MGSQETRTGPGFIDAAGKLLRGELAHHVDAAVVVEAEPVAARTLPKVARQVALHAPAAGQR